MGFFDDVGKFTSIAAKVAKEKVDEVSQDIKKANAEKEILNRKKAEERQQAILEQTAQEEKIKKLAKKVIVTTGDIRQDYEIIGPIFYQISNKGFFSSKLSNLMKKYDDEIKELEQNQNSVVGEIAMRLLIGEFSVGESEFEKAFFISTEELKRKVLAIGGNGIVHMRMDIDLDTEGFAYFYLQMYGTAVKIKES